MLAQFNKVVAVGFLLSASRGFGLEAALRYEPAERCYTWSHEPNSCVNNYCYYDEATGYCQEDHGPSPDCHLYDGEADFCRGVRHCQLDPRGGACNLITTGGSEFTTSVDGNGF